MQVIEADDQKPGYGLGVRHAQAALLFLAMVLAFAMRVNMSVAIVAMTDSSNEGAFNWSIQVQSVILSSFFWGYIVLQIPAGELAARFGGKLLITALIATNAVVCTVIPISAHYGGWKLVCACRIVQGLAQGFLNPAMHCLIGKWVPLEEKSRLGTYIYAGQQFGSALQLMISGFIAEYWGWPAIFYINGICGAIWTVAYVFIGADSPQSSKMISAEEQRYIQSSLGHVGLQKHMTTPWKSIFSSLSFISLIVAHCGQNWGFWTLMTEMPSYMNQVLGVNIKANGLMSALPYLAMVALSFPLGYLADLAIEKKWCSITAVRKISNSIGHYGPAIALIGLTYSPTGNVTIAVVLLTIVVGLNAGTYTGYLLVHIDMAPNFAGTLMGITNFFANIISIIAPVVAGVLLEDETSTSNWLKVFYLSSAIYLVCNTFFVIFGTSQKQTWNDPPEFGKSTGHYGPAIALIGLTYSPTGNVTIAVVLLTIVVGLNAGTYTGYLLVHIDMAPNFAGTLMGITNFFANIISIIAPVVAGVLLEDETSTSNWLKVFYLSSAIYLVCNTFFVIFGTSQKQTWNDPPEFGKSTDAESRKECAD